MKAFQIWHSSTWPGYGWIWLRLRPRTHLRKLISSFHLMSVVRQSFIIIAGTHFPFFNNKDFQSEICAYLRNRNKRSGHWWSYHNISKNTRLFFPWQSRLWAAFGNESDKSLQINYFSCYWVYALRRDGLTHLTDPKLSGGICEHEVLDALKSISWRYVHIKC